MCTILFIIIAYYLLYCIIILHDFASMHYFFITLHRFCINNTKYNTLLYIQTVRKTKRAVLSDSEDDAEIVKKNKKCSNLSEASKKKENGKQPQEISPDNIFQKKPILRIEEIKMSQKLQKEVNIIYK